MSGNSLWSRRLQPFQRTVTRHTFAFFLFILWAAPSISAGTLNVSIKSAAEQGEFVTASFETPPLEEMKISFMFLGSTAPCFPDPISPNRFQWTCLAAVPANALTGKQRYEIAPYGDPAFHGIIRIKKHKFPVETLTLSKEKKDLLKSGDDKDDEVKLIRKLFKTETSEKMWAGKFIKPVQGKIESLYGEKRILDGKLRENYYHRGLDLGEQHGKPLFASNGGKVLSARMFTEEGNMVMLDHGRGVISLYMHCSAMSVKEGDLVSKGQEIGKVGDTGVASTPHVHFGIYIHGTPIDPLFWLSHSPD